MMVELKDFS